MEHQNIINLIDNKIADRITKFKKHLQQNDSETVSNESDKEIPKERYISSEECQKNIYNRRLI